MTLKLPASEELETAPQEFTPESIDQLIAEAKKWPVENTRLLSALEFMVNEAKKGSSLIDTEASSKLTELLNTTTKKLWADEKMELESDLTNWDVNYVGKYIRNTEDSEKKVVALNVLLKKKGISEAKFTLSHAKWFFYYIWKSWYPIEFSFAPNPAYSPHVIFKLPKVGTSDTISLDLGWFTPFLKIADVIDENILLTDNMSPANPNLPFKYVWDNKIVFVSDQKNFLGKNKRINVKWVRLEDNLYSSTENDAIVVYLNSHRRVFSSGVFQKNEQETKGNDLSQGNDNLMLV